MKTEPAVHPAANASLWVPGLITPRAQTSGTMFPPESWKGTCRSGARRLWKPALSLSGLPSTVGEQKPLKSHCRAGSEHSWNFRNEITLKMEWREVYTTINKVVYGRSGFQMCACLLACGGASTTEIAEGNSVDTVEVVEGKGQIIWCFISKGRADRKRPAGKIYVPTAGTRPLPLRNCIPA